MVTEMNFCHIDLIEVFKEPTCLHKYLFSSLDGSGEANQILDCRSNQILLDDDFHIFCKMTFTYFVKN